MIYDRKGLLNQIRAQFRLNWYGIHGASHWARVKYHGQTIGKIRGADLLVVELFAFLHDSQRFNDGRDIEHGLRASHYARDLNNRYFSLNEMQLETLCEALKYHSHEITHSDITIQTCWDSDRLDIGRVGYKPESDFLSHEACAFIETAYAWSQKLNQTH